MGRTDLLIRWPKPNARARLRLFCFPYAGGGASVYYSWSNLLPPSVEVCPVQLPGREARLSEPPFTSMPVLVDHLAGALAPHLDVPFAFFGHSLGALVSFELARELRRRSMPAPVRLFVSGCAAPHRFSLSDPIYHLPDAEFIEGLRRLDGTPHAVLESADLMRLLMPVLRADFGLYESYIYTPEEPLDCPVSAYGGSQDHRVGLEKIKDWQDQTRGDFRQRIFPGNHFFLHANAALLTQAVSSDLAGAIV